MRCSSNTFSQYNYCCNNNTIYLDHPQTRFPITEYPNARTATLFGDLPVDYNDSDDDDDEPHETGSEYLSDYLMMVRMMMMMNGQGMGIDEPMWKSSEKSDLLWTYQYLRSKDLESQVMKTAINSLEVVESIGDEDPDYNGYVEDERFQDVGVTTIQSQIQELTDFSTSSNTNDINENLVHNSDLLVSGSSKDQPNIQHPVTAPSSTIIQPPNTKRTLHNRDNDSEGKQFEDDDGDDEYRQLNIKRVRLTAPEPEHQDIQSKRSSKDISPSVADNTLNYRGIFPPHVIPSGLLKETVTNNTRRISQKTHWTNSSNVDGGAYDQRSWCSYPFLNRNQRPAAKILEYLFCVSQHPLFGFDDDDDDDDDDDELAIHFREGDENSLF